MLIVYLLDNLIRPVILRLQLAISAHKKSLLLLKNHDLVTYSEQLLPSTLINWSLVLGITLLNLLPNLLCHSLPILSHILRCNTNPLSSWKLDQINCQLWDLGVHNHKWSFSRCSMN